MRSVTKTPTHPSSAPDMKAFPAMLSLAGAAVAQNIAIGFPQAGGSIVAGDSTVVSVWKPVSLIGSLYSITLLNITMFLRIWTELLDGLTRDRHWHHIASLHADTVRGRERSPWPHLVFGSVPAKAIRFGTATPAELYYYNPKLVCRGRCCPQRCSCQSCWGTCL